MMKATRRCAVLLGLIALGLVLGSMPSFAEVQNVKVSGDITVRALYRSNLDLHGEDERSNNYVDNDNPDDPDDLGILVPALDGQDMFFMSTVGLNVAADLTENVSAFIRLVNERDWNSDVGVGCDGAANAVDDYCEAQMTTDRGDIDLSQAYITLKELFYSPLTVRIGRQPIQWGRGFVLGSGLIPSLTGQSLNWNRIQNAGPMAFVDRNDAISADEYTDFTAFDAIRATIDLSSVLSQLGVPMTLDYVYIKLDEGDTGQPDDVNLQGVNLSTRFDSMNAEMEAYFLNKRDKSASKMTDLLAHWGYITADAAASEDDVASINTIGFRGSLSPMENLSVWSEIAYQYGRRTVDPQGVVPMGDSHQAWGVDLGTSLTLADVAMVPVIGAEWIYFSGKDVDGAIGGWDPLARGYYTTSLREFQAPGFYLPDQLCAVAGVTTACTGSQTNQHQLALFSSLKPMDDLTLSNRITWFVLDEGARSLGRDENVTTSRSKYAGFEWDMQALYDYTEDVQFGLLYALFAPGSTYVTPADSTAQQVVTTVSVKF